MSDCYKCKYRGNIPGNTHSRCNVISSTNEPSSKELELLIGSGLYKLVNSNTNEPLVKLNPHGVKMGWAIWPINFDPIWVEECSFYDEG